MNSSPSNQSFKYDNESISSSDSIILDKLAVPIAWNEHTRLRVLRETGLLDSDLNDPEFDRFTSLAKRIYKVPIAIVSLVDLDRQWFKSNIGLDVNQTERDFAFCSYTVLPTTEDVFVVHNALDDARFRNNPLVQGAPFIRFYAGAALMIDGVKIGSLCIIDRIPHPEFDMDMKMNLLDLGAAVSTLISKRREISLRQKSSRAKAVVELLKDFQNPLEHVSRVVESINSKVSKSPSKSQIQQSLAGIKSCLRELGTNIEANIALGTVILRKKTTLDNIGINDCTNLDVDQLNVNDINSSDEELECDESCKEVNFSGEVCDLFEIIEKAKHIISNVVGGKNIQWLIDRTYLGLGKHMCYPDVVLYVILSAIHALTRTWSSISVFIGFKKTLNHEHSSSCERKLSNIFEGRLSIEVRASDPFNNGEASQVTNSADNNSTNRSLRILNEFYGIEKVLQDIGGGQRKIDLQLQSREGAYINDMEYAYTVNGVSQPSPTQNSDKFHFHTSEESMASTNEVKKLCEYWLPCIIVRRKIRRKHQILEEWSPNGDQDDPMLSTPDSMMDFYAGCRILLVCKDYDHANKLSKVHKFENWLRSQGHFVTVASTGDEALKLLKFGNVRFDVCLLCDIQIKLESSGAFLLQAYSSWFYYQLAVTDSQYSNQFALYHALLIVGLEASQLSDNKVNSSQELLVTSQKDKDLAFGRGMSFFINDPFSTDQIAFSWLLTQFTGITSSTTSGANSVGYSYGSARSISVATVIQSMNQYIDNIQHVKSTIEVAPCLTNKIISYSI